jgi:transcription elongation factor GreB
MTFRLVGPDEFDFCEEYISMDSPLGKAVMGKALDEDITFRAPDGEARYMIVGVDYRGKKARPKAGRITGGNQLKKM